MSIAIGCTSDSVTSVKDKLFSMILSLFTLIKIFDRQLIMAFNYILINKIQQNFCTIIFSTCSQSDQAATFILLSSPDGVYTKYPVFILGLRFIIKNCSKTNDFNSTISDPSSRNSFQTSKTYNETVRGTLMFLELLQKFVFGQCRMNLHCYTFCFQFCL